MKIKIYSSLGSLLFLTIPFFVMGCVSEPVKINWPANHPANSDTQAAEFIRPANPFETDMAAMKEEPGKDAMMKLTMPKEGGMQHMDHHTGAGKKNHSESESKMKPEQTEGHKQHQEHSQ